jgi:CheY-like chemotaxis protein
MPLSIFAFKRIRWLHRSREIKNLKSGILNTIIEIMAQAMADDEEKSIATGMEEHVTKRVDQDEFFASS